MLSWSKYTRLLKSERFGYLLYNSLSNTLAQVDKDAWEALQEIKKDPAGFDFSEQQDFLEQLLETRIVYRSDGEQKALQEIQRARHERNALSKQIQATILPTMSCNFRCTYCFQEGLHHGSMSPKIEEQTIRFLSNLGGESLDVMWFGGEPLLRPDIIERMTQKFIAHFKDEYSAGIITNGYLLEKTMCERFDEWRIAHAQITLDGRPEVHDTRRVLVNGGPTYDVILRNIDTLLEHSNAVVPIRVNLDTRNCEEFARIYTTLMERFNDERVFVYPGVVLNSYHGNTDVSCTLRRREMSDYLIELYNQHGVETLSFFPDRDLSGCVATQRSGFVISPEGKINACMQDVGFDKDILGHVSMAPEELNWELKQDYMSGHCPFDDAVCRECFYLPVCDGGCVKRRQLNKQAGNRELETCARMKGKLREFMEATCALELAAEGAHAEQLED